MVLVRANAEGVPGMVMSVRPVGAGSGVCKALFYMHRVLRCSCSEQAVRNDSCIGTYERADAYTNGTGKGRRQLVE